MIYAPFGDSHSVFWSGGQSFDRVVATVEGIPSIHWIGPAKIWGLANPTDNKTKEKFERLLSFELNNSDVVPIACMGEIDIRVNLAKRVLKSRGFDEIASLARIYLQKLSEIQAPEVIVWGPPPSVPDRKNISSEYPVYGDCVTRNCITHLFNRQVLLNINSFKKIKFLTMFYDLIDDDMNTSDGALHDGMHLSVAHVSRARLMLEETKRQEVKAIFNFARYQAIGDVGFGTVFDKGENSSFVKARKVNSSGSLIYFSRLAAPQELAEFGELVLRAGSTEECPVNQVLECADEEYLSHVYLGVSTSDFSGYSEFLKDKNIKGFRNYFDALVGIDNSQAAVFVNKFATMLDNYFKSGASEWSEELRACAVNLFALVGRDACAPIFQKCGIAFDV